VREGERMDRKRRQLLGSSATNSGWAIMKQCIPHPNVLGAPGRLTLWKKRRQNGKWPEHVAQRMYSEPGVVAHTFNPSTWEAEAGGFLSSRPLWATEWVPGQPGLHRVTLSWTPPPPKKRKKKEIKNSCEGLAKLLNGKGSLAPYPITWVQFPEATWGKERTDPCKVSCMTSIQEP
jgi:hypothetical protein